MSWIKDTFQVLQKQFPTIIIHKDGNNMNVWQHDFYNHNNNNNILKNPQEDITIH